MSDEIIDHVEDIPFIRNDQNVENTTYFYKSAIPIVEDCRNKKVFCCELCDVKVTSRNVLRRHQEGKKHIRKQERGGQIYECQLCDTRANSQSQLDAHLNSFRHKNRLLSKERSYENKGTWVVLFAIISIFIIFLSSLMLFKIF